MQSKTNKITCPSCLSKNVKKHSIQKNKLQNYQRYYCNNCKRTFSLHGKNKTYPLNVILTALSLYNLGHTQTQIINKISRKFKIKPSQKTISNWINEHKDICTFNKLRKQATKLYSPEEIIEAHSFMHNNLPYIFQIHKAKLNLLFNSELYNNKFSDIKKFEQPLISYFKKISTNEFPHHIFRPKTEPRIKPESETLQKLERSSQLKFKTLKFTKLEKRNLANTLTNLALNLTKTNRQRHQSIQDFMLVNDSTTIATEVPVYLTKDDIKYFLKKGFQIPLENQQTPVTGHIDIIQIRNGLIHILDYKPEANKVNPINQLTLYALALASRTKLAVKDFKCAWFDDKNYYEFFPLHVVYPKKKIERFI